MCTLKTIKATKIKEIAFRKRRKELLVDTIKDLLAEKILNGVQIAGILKISTPTFTRLKNDTTFSISAEKVEQFIKLLSN